MSKTACFLSMILMLANSTPVFSWSWDSAESAMPSLRDDLDREIAAYRQQVLNGMTIRDRIVFLDRLIDNYKPMGLNVAELDTERSRLILEEKQQQLRNSEAQTQATVLFDKGVAQYREGDYRGALETFQGAERLLPQDSAIKETRRRLTNINPILDQEMSPTHDAAIIRLAISHYLENDPKRALNALRYADDKKVDRAELSRLQRLIESDHPEVEAVKLPSGVSLVDHKLQMTLEAIYDGRYLSAISECADVLDLEPDNVLALTRLGSAYFAMNEKEKAKQIWTKALQLDPNNEILKKFLYGSRGSSRVENR